MAKRKPVAVLMLILLVSAPSALRAGFSYRLDALSFSPIHDEYLADPDSGSLSFSFLDIYEGFPDHVFQDGSAVSYEERKWEWDPEVFPFRSDSRLMTKGHAACRIKLGESLSLLRNTFTFDGAFSPVSFDFTFSGAMTVLMEGAMADMMAYDGAYFFGLTLSVGDFFSLRTGFRHICTHYGDAVLKAVQAPGENRTDRGTAPSSPPAPGREDFSVTYKYVRMNGCVLGLSVSPLPWLRIYGEWDFVPKGISSLRPVMFQPVWIDRAMYPERDTPESYGASIAAFGAEVSIPHGRKPGRTVIAYDLHMYEEGRIRYRHPDGSYFGKDEMPYWDSSLPWTMSHSIVLVQELGDSVSLEAGWHTGRSPLHTFWYMESPSWFHIALRADTDLTLTIFDNGGKE